MPREGIRAIRFRLGVDKKALAASVGSAMARATAGRLAPAAGDSGAASVVALSQSVAEVGRRHGTCLTSAA